MHEPLSLAAVRREQRRVAALLDASKQLGVILPGRQDNIPLDDLYKSNYYLQLQAEFRQMYISGSQQTALSLPEMERLMKTRGNGASDVWMPDTNRRKPTAVVSLGSTLEGWKHLRKIRETRESISKRNQFRIKRSTGKKRTYEPSDGMMGWPPDQATRELWSRENITSDTQTGDLIGRKMIEKSRGLKSASLSDIVHQAGNIDYRLPRLAKPGPLRKDPDADRSPTEDPTYSGQNTRQSSVTGKPLLRYNHGNKGQGMDLSQKDRPGEFRRNREETSYDWSIYSDSPDDTYQPFYPQTPSVSPASLDSVNSFDLVGLSHGMDSNYLYSRVQYDPNHDGEDVMGTVHCLDPSGNQGLEHVRQHWDTESMHATADSAMKHGKDKNEPPHSTLNTTKNRGFSRTNTKDPEISLDPYRDAYARALAVAVARSRLLPHDFTGLGTRTTRAFSYSYFAHHRATCKCQKCLERVLRNSPLKRPAKKRRPPQGAEAETGQG